MTNMILVVLVLTAPDGATLTGQVADAEGNPLAARVFISTAGPRHGTATLCPGCYPDCTKHTETDSDGRFTIEGLDRALVFRVLTIADKHRPVIRKVDPATEQLNVSLDLQPTELPPNQMLRGIVLDDRGKPVVGAIVDPFGARTEERRWWGRLEGVDQLAVTDDKGEFLLTATKPFLGFDVEVTAPACAMKNFELLPTGETVHQLTLEEGASVMGSVVMDGQPVAGIDVGLCQLDRSIDNFTKPYRIQTDKRGRFEFLNLPANEDFVIYTHMDRSARGGLEIAQLKLGDHKSVFDTGALELSPSFSISGHVRLTDGKAIPSGTRIMVSRQEAWDPQTYVVGDDGSFSFSGVPAEGIELFLRVPGYTASQKTRMQIVQMGGLAVFVDRDLPALEIWLKPGEPSSR